MREKTFDKVKDFVKENEMLARNCAVIAGVSGGNDSMTMLHLLRRLREIWHFHLRVVHVNHGIRGAEADRDQRWRLYAPNRISHAACIAMMSRSFR